jgi:hypothetical protein
VTDQQPGDPAGDRPDRLDRVAAKAAGRLLAAVVLITAFFLLPLPRIHLPHLVSRWSPLHDLPGWLHFLFGPGKVLVIAALFVLAGVGETRRRRGGDRPDEPRAPDSG